MTYNIHYPPIRAQAPPPPCRTQGLPRVFLSKILDNSKSLLGSGTLQRYYLKPFSVPNGTEGQRKDGDGARAGI